MKKITPYILIFFIFVNLFAPLSVVLNDKGIAINKIEAIAADCAVTSVTFTPAGGSTNGTAIPLPSSIIAKIKTANCISKNIEFNIKETFNYWDAFVFTKQINVSSDEIELKLTPTELKCGSENLCGFKYIVNFGANTSQYGWSDNFKSSNSEDYFYKCNTASCTNQSPWTGVISSGAEASTDKASVNYKIDMSGKVTNTDNTATVNIIATDKTDYTNLGAGSITYTYYLNIILKDATNNIVDQKKITYANWTKKIDPITFSIKAKTSYIIDSSIDVFETTLINGQSSGKTYPEISALTTPISFTSNVAGDQTINDAGIISASAENKVSSGSLPACSINSLMGCVAQGIYYVLFQPTSYLFALSGTLFDNAFAYSVDSASYRSPFVVEGWKVVRDFCNMFFIFILLYIAFGTILNLNGVKTKEMIINVVLIGIFINFSLFASQVIIDASNILARVFYNSNTITVKINDPSVGSNVIPLSAALVNKINPQEIILSASQVNTVQDTRGKGGGATDTTADAATNISTGTFILVTLLATIVNGVGIFVFFSISIIFIARVIGLWLAMILVPFAFLSYTVPAMQNFEMVGWKKWWPETIKLAFLAPVFIFFLYLILKFIEKGFMIVQNDAQPFGLNLMIGIILPFVFIMILLLKAKSVATDMSGKIGETLAKAGATVGGMVVGGAGGLAMGALAGVGRRTIGALGEKMGNSETLKDSGIIGRGLANAGRWTAGKNFDVRSTKLGAAAGKGMGVDFGKAKEGGYTKYKEDKIKKKQQTAKNLEVGENSPLMHDLHAKEEASQKLKNDNSLELTALDAKITAQGPDAAEKNNNAIGLEKIVDKAGKDADGKSLATQEQQDAAEKARGIAIDAARILQENKDKKIALRTGSFDELNKKYRTSNGNISEDRAKAVDDNVVDNAIAQASDDQKEATASGEAAADAINYVESGTAAADALTAKNTAISNATLEAAATVATAATDKQNAKDAADAAEIVAISKAATDTQEVKDAADAAEIVAKEKAAADKVAAIEAAQARVTAATAAAAAAEMAHSLNPNKDNDDARIAANTARANANANLVTTTTEAESREITAVAKAATDKQTTRDAADAAGLIATTKAAADKVEADRVATDAEVAAIKAASDAINTAIKNANDAQAKATASGTNAAEKMRDLAAKNAAGGNYGKSINDLDFIDIPEAKHAISKVNNGRKIKLADEYSNRIFNTEINRIASHDIRMNSEIKADVKGH